MANKVDTKLLHLQVRALLAAVYALAEEPQSPARWVKLGAAMARTERRLNEDERNV